MPRYDLDRGAFVDRIKRRQCWAYHWYRVRRRLGLPLPPLQTAVYDATFRSDADAVTFQYALFNDHMPDFDDPVWVNEKIRWQFLHHPNPLMVLTADKMAVRNYLRLKGAKVTPPALVASGQQPLELASAELPARFVLKSTYGSGQNHMETGVGLPTPRSALVATVGAWAEWDQWRHTGELHYRGIPKRWLVEEYLPSTRERLEFKFYCVLGEPVFVTVICDRSAKGYKRAVYDLDWRRIEVSTSDVDVDVIAGPVPRPPEFQLMVAEALRLSADFLHVRVDFLRFDGRLVFSELTFASLAASRPFVPLPINRALGYLMDLNKAPDYLARGCTIAAELGWRPAPVSRWVDESPLPSHNAPGRSRQTTSGPGPRIA